MTRILPDDDQHGFATRAVHAGQVVDPLAGAVMTPIYQTSTYVQEGLGRHRGYEYARTQNPTREALERNVASLEDGRHGFAFGSGLASLDAVLKLLRAGDHVVCGDNVYGGTQRLMEQIYAGLARHFLILLDWPRISRQILRRAELERIDEDAHHREVGFPSRPIDETDVSCVKRSHCGNETDPCAVGACLRNRGSCFRDGLDYVHASCCGRHQDRCRP